MSNNVMPKGTGQQLAFIVEYLESCINSASFECLSLDDFSEDVKPYAATINQIIDNIGQLYEFALDLSKGRLNTSLPPRGNLLTGSLKSLHSQMLHLTWQAGQVASGDYTQTVEFMGEFSNAFNQMVRLLAARESRLIKNHSVLLAVLENMPYCVVAIDNDKAVLFSNKEAEEKLSVSKANNSNGVFAEDIIDKLYLSRNELPHFELYDPNEDVYYGVSNNKSEWINGDAVNIFILSDITSVKNSEKSLRESAFFDITTTIGNKANAFGYIEKLLKDKISFSTVFIDMDNLKMINDQFGHKEGDSALREFAQILVSSVREKENVFRIGGDEFLIIMVNTKESVANSIVKRIRNQILKLSDDMIIRFSFGVYYHDGAKDETLEEIINLADKEMYIDKRNRKNKRK